MFQTLKSDSAPWLPQSEIEIAQIREQLNRLLVHPLFHQSKRYPAVLQYVVEQTLLRNADRIKERSIGVDVFDREASYDTNADPIVRLTVSEIRKRLALYYFDQTHAGELQIELPTGSYVPVFHKPAVLGGPVQTSAHSELGSDPAFDATSPAPLRVVEEQTASRQVSAPAKTPHSRWRIASWSAICAALILIAGLGVGFWRHMLPRPGSHSRVEVNSLDKFWSPIIAAPGIATFCIGEPNIQDDTGSSSAQQSLLKKYNLSGHLAVGDVVTLTSLSAALQARGKPFYISTSSQASFTQLRAGPVILIGALDNTWTERLTQNLRFHFSTPSGTTMNSIDSIVDRRNPTQFQWSIALNTPYQKIAKDYAIIARFYDGTIDQPTVLVAGITEAGTESAGELLSNPNYFAALLKQAPDNWQNMNMEAVIETEVFGGHPGPPRILAVEFW